MSRLPWCLGTALEALADSATSMPAAAAAARPTLTSTELRYVLSNPERFGLKEFVWYALDAPQWWAETHKEHSLASRLGVGVVELGGAAAQWLTTSGEPVLAGRTSAIRVAINSLARLDSTPLPISCYRSTHQVPVGDGKQRHCLRIPYPVAALRRYMYRRQLV